MGKKEETPESNQPPKIHPLMFKAIIGCFSDPDSDDHLTGLIQLFISIAYQYGSVPFKPEKKIVISNLNERLKAINDPSNKHTEFKGKLKKTILFYCKDEKDEKDDTVRPRTVDIEKWKQLINSRSKNKKEITAIFSALKNINPNSSDEKKLTDAETKINDFLNNQNEEKKNEEKHSINYDYKAYEILSIANMRGTPIITQQQLLKNIKIIIDTQTSPTEDNNQTNISKLYNKLHQLITFSAPTDSIYEHADIFRRAIQNPNSTIHKILTGKTTAN